MVETGRRASGMGPESRGRPQPKHTTLQQQQQSTPSDNRSAEGSKHILCRQIEAAGKCSWGDRCWFAHDVAEQEQGKRQRQPGHKGSNPNPKHEQRQATLMNWPSERDKVFSTQQEAAFGRKPQSSQKHQLCPHLPHGRCTHGDSCWYSHSLEEQQAAVGKAKSRAAEKSIMEAREFAQSGPQKDQLCVKFGRGLCTRGDKCWFAHSLAEQRDAIKQKQEEGITSKVDNQQQAKAHTLAEKSRKHLPCQILKSGKACTLGAKCPFAHGEHERRLALEALQQHSNQPEPSADALSLQQVRSDVDPAEPADRPHPNDLSSPNNMVACLDPNTGEEASLRKQTICTALRQGHCPAGDRCRFSHSQQERLHTVVGASTTPQTQEASGTPHDKQGPAMPESRHQLGNTRHPTESCRPVQDIQTGPAAMTADQPSSSSLARPRRPPGSGMRAWPETGQHALHEPVHQPESVMEKPNDAQKPSATGGNSLPEHSKSVTNATARSRASGTHSGHDSEQHRWEHAEAEQQQQDPHALPGRSKKHIPCLMFAKHGRCPRGAICWFAHGPDELQAAHIQQLEDKHLQKKINKRDVDAAGLRLCVYFRQGRCERGTSCLFSHASPAVSPIRRPPMHEQAGIHSSSQRALKQTKASPDSTLSGVDEHMPAATSRSSSPHRMPAASLHPGQQHDAQAPFDAWTTAIEDAVNSTGQGSPQQQDVPASDDSQADKWSSVLDGIVGKASAPDGPSQQHETERSEQEAWSRAIDSAVSNADASDAGLQEQQAKRSEQEAWSRAIESAVSNADASHAGLQDMSSSSLSDQTGDMGPTAMTALANVVNAGPGDADISDIGRAASEASSRDGQQDTADAALMDTLASSNKAGRAHMTTEPSDTQQQQLQFQPERPDQDAWAAVIDEALLSAATSADQAPPQFGTFFSSPGHADLAAPSPAWHPASQMLHQGMGQQTGDAISSDAAQSGSDVLPTSNTAAGNSAMGLDGPIFSKSPTEGLHNSNVDDAPESAPIADQQQAPGPHAASQLSIEAANSSQESPAGGSLAGASGRPALEGFEEGFPAEFHLPAETSTADGDEQDAADSDGRMHQGPASPDNPVDAPTTAPSGQQDNSGHAEAAAAPAAPVAPTDATSPTSTSATTNVAAALDTSSEPKLAKGPVDADDLEALELDEEASKYAPALLRCPLTKEIFRNPVIAKDGRTFERSALLAWWAKHATFPYSNKTAYDRSLVPNAALRAAINALYGLVPVRPQPVGMR